MLDKKRVGFLLETHPLDRIFYILLPVLLETGDINLVDRGGATDLIADNNQGFSVGALLRGNKGKTFGAKITRCRTIDGRILG